MGRIVGFRRGSPRSAVGKQDVERLLREMQGGRSKEEHFKPIFELYCREVTNFFTKRGFSAQEAEELAQDVFLRVYRNIGAFRFEASFETWLFRIAGNVWKNALRSLGAGKRRGEELSIDGAADQRTGEEEGYQLQLQDAASDPLQLALADERTKILGNALEDLPPKMRQCMLLRIGEELKYREIAAVMQVSIATVKSQLSEGHRRLKPMLEQHFEVFTG